MIRTTKEPYGAPVFVFDHDTMYVSDPSGTFPDPYIVAHGTEFLIYGSRDSRLD
jgi:hypothetical protein